MLWLLAILAAATASVPPTHLSCEIGTGAHRSVFDVELNEQTSTAIITIGSAQAKSGPAIFGPHYITIVQLIGKEAAMTTISRSDLSARQSVTISNVVQFGSCKPYNKFAS